MNELTMSNAPLGSVCNYLLSRGFRTVST